MVNVNKPEKKIRAGAINATIWKNTIVKDDRTFDVRTVQIERNYKDEAGWHSTGSLRSADIPLAILVLQKAYEFVALSEDKFVSDQQSEFKPANEEVVSNNPIY